MTEKELAARLFLVLVEAEIRDRQFPTERDRQEMMLAVKSMAKKFTEETIESLKEKLGKNA